ncbi:MAG TPA: GIY-YIG nuclease family protein [Chthoniobacterales bacterium]|nr:GIY-YIG nuclease family protein [Chthoniobacterales bacterium]
MAKEITDDDLELLGELGVETAPVPTGGRPAREQRIIAGFEEIERFVQEHGRPPAHGERRDIFERIYATRLDSLRRSAECRALLKEKDTHGLLGADDDEPASRVKEEPSDEELLNALGVAIAPSDDVTQLVHVRSRDEIKAAEEIAQRNPCRDFDQFQPIFEKAQRELGRGERQTLKYKDNADVKAGDLFILDGQKVLVAEMDEPFVTEYGRPDRRLRVVYDNGTESDLLLRSLQRALNKDKTSRRITEPELGPLFSDEEEEDDLPAGYIYVLRSKSDHPFIAENRSVIHKIGITGGDVETRIANAKKDATYLFADVELVATYKLSNINRARLEALLHKFFSSARLELVLNLGGGIEPREWFLVPVPVIEDAIQKLRDGSIGSYRYNPENAQIERCGSRDSRLVRAQGLS